MEKFLWQPAIEDELVDVTRRVRPVPTFKASARCPSGLTGKSRRMKRANFSSERLRKTVRWKSVRMHSTIFE